MASTFSAPTAQFTASIAGQPADVALTAYADRLMVVCTQLGTLGAVLAAEREPSLGSGPTYRVDTLLGRRDDPLPELAARQLAERLAEAGCDRPLLLCLALAKGALTPAAVGELIDAVLQHPVWAAAGQGAAAAQQQQPPAP